jgi:hypothetical protein
MNRETLQQFKVSPGGRAAISCEDARRRLPKACSAAEPRELLRTQDVDEVATLCSEQATARSRADLNPA